MDGFWVAMWMYRTIRWMVSGCYVDVSDYKVDGFWVAVWMYRTIRWMVSGLLCGCIGL